MKLTRRFMVFLTGFASLVFASAHPATIHEASAAKIAFPPRVVWAPIGVFTEIVYKVNGVVKNPDANNQILYTAPNTLLMSSRSNCSVPGGYARTVTFTTEWKLQGANTYTGGWGTTLAPGNSANSGHELSSAASSGNYEASMKITWVDSNGKGTCENWITNFVALP